MLARSFVELQYQWTVGVSEIWNDKKTRRTEQQIVAVAVETQLRLSALSAWDIRRAEQQRVQRRLDLRRHLSASARTGDGIARLGDATSFHHVLRADRSKHF